MKPHHFISFVLLSGFVAVLLAGCATSHRSNALESPARFLPSSELLQSGESGDPETRCKLGWLYLAHNNYAEAAKWLLKSGNINSTGAAGRLLIDGLSVAQDVPRGMQCLRRGAEAPNTGGNEECALDMARIYEKGELVPCNDSEAYYFLGICVAKCSGWDEALEQRSQLIVHQRAIGARLTSDDRMKQDARLRKWLDDLKSGSCRSLGELDSETTDVSVYLDEEDEASVTASNPATLLKSQDIALTQLGKRLKELNVPENATIRIYPSVDLSPTLQAKIRKSLVNQTVNFSNQVLLRSSESPRQSTSG